jgi:integrase
LRRLASFVLPKLGNLQLGRIGRLDIMDLLDTRAKQVKPSTVNRDHSLLSCVFSLAIEKGYIEESKSPTKGIKKRAENNTNKKILPSHTQLKALMNKCTSMPEEKFGCDLILLLIYTGLRVSEALSLRRCDIAEDVKSFRLIENKSKRPIQLPLNTEAQKIVRRCLSNTWNDYLFPSPIIKDKPMSAPRRLLALLKNEVGLKEFGFHYCRAIFISIISIKNIHLASKLANHSNSVVTERYIYHTDEVMTSASELVVQHLN